jgi:hypothetical protein
LYCRRWYLSRPTELREDARKGIEVLIRQILQVDLVVERTGRVALHLDRLQLRFFVDQKLAVKVGDLFAIIALVALHLCQPTGIKRDPSLVMGYPPYNLIQSTAVEIHHPPHAQIAVARTNTIEAQFLALLRRKVPQSLPGLPHLVSVRDNTTGRHPDFLFAFLNFFSDILFSLKSTSFFQIFRKWVSLKIEQKIVVYQCQHLTTRNARNLDLTERMKVEPRSNRRPVVEDRRFSIPLNDRSGGFRDPSDQSSVVKIRRQC